MKKYWLDFIFAITHPNFWLQSGTFSEEFDRWLLDAIETSDFKNIDRFHATIKGKELWVANYPYAAYQLKDIRPCRRTVKLARAKLMTNILEG